MKKIHVAHSPDSDDAFMFYGLATGKIETGEFEFEHHLDDIETLNRAAFEGRYEVTAISIHAYAYLADQYALLNSGASMGEGYGPVVIAREAFPATELGHKLVAVPGEKTSAYLALRLFNQDFSHEVFSFDEIVSAVEQGKVDAGVVIHEAQLFFPDHGLKKIVDLGEWWNQETGLPLPLGGNVIRRDIPAFDARVISRLIHESIRYSLEHRDEALDYALQFGRGLDETQGDRFVNMYVNSRTLDYGSEGREAVQLFLDKGYEAGILPHSVQVEFM